MCTALLVVGASIFGKPSASNRNKTINPLISIRIETISKIQEIVDRHIETLARRRLALLTIDHYGIADGSAWNKEVQRFVDKVVRPELSEQEAGAVASNMNALFQEMIEVRVRLRSDEIEAELDYSDAFTPTQFEQWCAKTLNSKGWKAITTKASGDQGADVIAEKKGTRVVLQCKLYSGTVGNKAVQEAYSAQRHYATNASAVVTNANFSPSARKLASTTGVFLLHYGDLTRLDSLLAQRNLNRDIPS
jgi:restriction system protein